MTQRIKNLFPHWETWLSHGGLLKTLHPRPSPQKVLRQDAPNSVIHLVHIKRPPQTTVEVFATSQLPANVESPRLISSGMNTPEYLPRQCCDERVRLDLGAGCLLCGLRRRGSEYPLLTHTYALGGLANTLGPSLTPTLLGG